VLAVDADGERTIEASLQPGAISTPTVKGGSCEKHNLPGRHDSVDRACRSVSYVDVALRIGRNAYGTLERGASNVSEPAGGGSNGWNVHDSCPA